MKQEAFQMSLLLDYYGGLLTEKQKTYFDLYYNQDLSLGEIAEQEGVSRQSIHDTIARTQAILRTTEEAAGCLAMARRTHDAAREVIGLAQGLQQHADPEVRRCAQGILSAASQLLKE